jgi:septum formation protein
MRIRLASGSPRRAELLRSAGFDLVVTPSSVPEQRMAAESPEAYVERLAREKAGEVWDRFSDLPVLGADTVVVQQGEVLEKPRDDGDAVRMLTTLSEQRHSVITGFAWVHSGGVQVERVETVVQFRHLTAAEISAYVASGDPMDKAGGYGIQSGAAHFVSRIEGSYTNVVGLPMAQVFETWRALFAEPK